MGVGQPVTALPVAAGAVTALPVAAGAVTALSVGVPMTAVSNSTVYVPQQKYILARYCLGIFRNISWKSFNFYICLSTLMKSLLADI